MDRVDPHPDVAVVFTSGRLGHALGATARAVEALLAPAALIGARVEACFAGGHDATSGHGIAVWVGHLGGVQALRLDLDENGGIVGWPADVPDGATSLVLAHRSFPLHALDEASGGAGAGGGIVAVSVVEASRPSTPSTPALLDAGGPRTAGAVGVTIAPEEVDVFEFETPPVLDHDGDDEGLDGAAATAAMSGAVPTHLVRLGPGAGALVLADRTTDVVARSGPDLDALVDRFAGAMLGAVGRRITPTTGGPPPPGVTALVFR